MNRRRPVQTKSFKDYLIPVIGVVIFFAIVVNFIVRWGDEPVVKPEISAPKLEVVVPADVEAYVFYKNDDKEKIEGSFSLNQGERIHVKNGNLSIDSKKLNLSANSEVAFSGDNKYTIMSWNVFASNAVPTEFEMVFANVVAWPSSVISLSQNAISSKISVLSWTASISLNSWDQYDVNAWEQSVILNSTSEIENLDTASLIKVIPDYELEDDWLVLNNASSFITNSSSDDDTEWENSDNLQSLISNKGREFVLFDTEDESSVSSTKLLLVWDILSNEVDKILVSGIEAQIDRAEATFSVEINLTSKENDLVYKIYDEEDILLQKDILTIYSSTGSSSSSTVSALENTTLETYPINQEFWFTTPNPASTTWGFYTIKGFVPANTVDHIIVNGYKLRQFSSWGTTWRYHADETYGLLKDGVNLYKVQYYDTEGKLITTSLYTINKTSVETPTEVKKMSDEAQ